MNSKAKQEQAEGEKSDASIHSQGRVEGASSADKFYSFSQSFANLEPAERALQERSSSASRVRALEEEVKALRARCALWEKAKGEIVKLNKYLKLSSITLGCSDAAIMKEFFESTQEILEVKEEKAKDERSKVADSKRKEAELFEKLVESNKRKYELQQKLVQFEHEITKLSDINESLREKSRTHSTTSKIRDLQEDTLMTLHQRDSEFFSLEQRNNELKLDVARLEETVETLNSQLHSNHHHITHLTQANQDLILQVEASKLQITRMKEAEEQTEATFLSIKEEVTALLQENEALRKEVKQMRSVMEEAKSINQEFLNQTQASLLHQETERQARIEQLLRKEEEVLKKKLSNSIKFACARRKSRKSTQKIPSQMLLLPSEELLI